MLLNEPWLSRRHLMLGAAALGAAGVAPAQEIGLPMPTSLVDELTAALKKHSPLLVMVSLPVAWRAAKGVSGSMESW